MSLVAASGTFKEAARETEAPALLTVTDGPDLGKTFPLYAGANYIGRDRGNEVRLTDPMVSKQHARVNVAETVEIIDLGSSNGILIENSAVVRATVRPSDVVLLGDTQVRIEVRSGAHASVMTPTVEFNRSPQLDSVVAEAEFEAPQPPAPAARARLPFIPLIAPVLMGCILFAVTRQLISIAFVALSPLMMVGNVLEGRRAGRKAHEASIAAFRTNLATMAAELSVNASTEVEGRLREQPSAKEVCSAALGYEPGLWSRRPDRRGFLEVRLGLGRLPSRTKVKLPRHNDAAAELWQEARALADRFATVDGVPVVAGFREVGSVGVAGPRRAALACARSIAVQLLGLHSPAELIVVALGSSASAADWDWLKWAPHTSSDHSPITTDHLVAAPGSAVALVSALELLVASRRSGETRPTGLPAIVAVVDDDVPIERSRLVELAETGPPVGLHLLWIAPTVAELPAACRAFVEVDLVSDTTGTVGYVDGGLAIVPVELERLEATEAVVVARALAPVVDAGARVDDDSDLPRSVSLLSIVGTEAGTTPEFVIDRWRMSHSLGPGTEGGERQRRRGYHLRTSIGATSGQTFVLDLREHGPHALVGGTTGSGKSEFLQSWILGMALEHSPARVTFLFVDYKGGAAFSECVRLPHSVGLVTDLSPHLVRRALTSLNAELRYRERILREKRAKDLLELERRDDPDTPPSLVIIVDEFAALVAEVPEFVDGVVNVAQRGRSLGLHLVLATQRPTGVIKDNLRANTNLRIALRVADEGDSVDVVGTPQAAAFDPAIPGRAMAKIGPGRPIPFQSGYVGGWTSDTPPEPVILIEELRFGGLVPWPEPEPDLVVEAPAGPTDLSRMVANIQAAHKESGLKMPRRPWLDTLAPVYDLARSPQSRTDSELIFGILDDPARQQQVPVAFFPDRDGNMAVFGTGGSGKSVTLRSLAIVAGLSIRGGPCHVYGMDFGARGLQMLEPLPHVGAIINADDDERIRRLLRFLRQEIDERASRFAAARAGSIVDYRRATGNKDEPRILLLVDGIGAFRQAYEAGERARWFDMFQGIAADGRQVGIHVVVSADRNAAVPTALGSVIQRRLVLRLANEIDYAMLGVPADVFTTTSPPGRGYIDDAEIQVAVLGGTPNTARQAAAIAKLAESLADTVKGGPPRPIERLADRVLLEDLPVSIGDRPSLGLADESLAAIAFHPEGVLAVVGPPQSGKTSVLATLAVSLHRWRPRSPMIHLATIDSPLSGLLPWAETAAGADDVAALAKDLADRLNGRTQNLKDLTIILEGAADYLNTPADLPLLELLKVCRAKKVFVATDAETATMSSSWPLLQAIKATRHGIALQPDQLDGDTVFKTSFPRMSRVEFPPGRGMYVRNGAAVRVQCALPEVSG